MDSYCKQYCEKQKISARLKCILDTLWFEVIVLFFKAFRKQM